MGNIRRDVMVMIVFSKTKQTRQNEISASIVAVKIMHSLVLSGDVSSHIAYTEELQMWQTLFQHRCISYDVLFISIDNMRLLVISLVDMRLKKVLHLCFIVLQNCSSKTRTDTFCGLAFNATNIWTPPILFWQHFKVLVWIVSSKPIHASHSTIDPLKPEWEFVLKGNSNFLACMSFDEIIQTKTLKCCQNSIAEGQIFVASNAKPQKVSVLVLLEQFWSTMKHRCNTFFKRISTKEIIKSLILSIEINKTS